MLAKYENLPLGEALNQFREEQGLTQKYADTGPDSKHLLDRHDVMHVLFDLDTSFPEEARADYWSIFGSDVKWADLKSYFDLPEQKELIDEFGWPRMIGLAILSLPSAVKIAFKSRKLKKKWGWHDYVRYLDTPVGKIRREFGIDQILTETARPSAKTVKAA